MHSEDTTRALDPEKEASAGIVKARTWQAGLSHTYPTKEVQFPEARLVGYFKYSMWVREPHTHHYSSNNGNVAPRILRYNILV